MTRPLLIALALNALWVVVALLLYHRLWVAEARTDRERDAALEQVTAFAQRLSVALDELPRECACLVVVKGAATAPPGRLRDLTGELQRKVTPP